MMSMPGIGGNGSNYRASYAASEGDNRPSTQMAKVA